MAGYVRDVNSLSGADGLEVQGNYAYISSGGSNSLSIIDISSPGNPVITSVLTDAGGRLDRAWGVTVEGIYAYVVGGFSGTSDRLTIVDVSNPAAPRLVGSGPAYTSLDGAVRVGGAGHSADGKDPHERRLPDVARYGP